MTKIQNFKHYYLEVVENKYLFRSLGFEGWKVFEIWYL